MMTFSAWKPFLLRKARQTAPINNKQHRQTGIVQTIHGVNGDYKQADLFSLDKEQDLGLVWSSEMPCFENQVLSYYLISNLGFHFPF